MKKKRVIVVVLLILVVVAIFPCYHYLKTRVLWKNKFSLEYVGSKSASTGHSFMDEHTFLGWEYTITNNTSSTYELQYVYVHVEPIIRNAKTVKIKLNKVIYPNSSQSIVIRVEDVLEALNLDNVPIWGYTTIRGFDYKKK